jgi:hypothetical protein
MATPDTRLESPPPDRAVDDSRLKTINRRQGAPINRCGEADQLVLVRQGYKARDPGLGQGTDYLTFQSAHDCL